MDYSSMLYLPSLVVLPVCVLSLRLIQYLFFCLIVLAQISGLFGEIEKSGKYCFPAAFDRCESKCGALQPGKNFLIEQTCGKLDSVVFLLGIFLWPGVF